MGKSKMQRIAAEDGGLLSVALYVRVSTDRQAEEGYSIEVQKQRLQAYTGTLDGVVTTEVYVDDGFSGATLERPAIQRLIKNALEGRLTHVCVYKLDRLSRSQKDTLHLIEDVFLPNNIAFVSVQESFNTATAFGRAVVGILSVFAQLERENIYERTRSGMQKRVEAGYWPGGGGVPFGYDYDAEKGILTPNEDAATVRRIYELYLEGYSLQSIANLLGLKYEKLAAQIMARKTNIGIIEYNGTKYKGLHSPIVEKKIFERAMELKRLRSEKRLSPRCVHLLTGLVYCGVCGAKMRYQKWGQAGCKLVCYSQQRSKPYLVHDPDCKNETVWAEPVEKAVISDLFSMTAPQVEGGEAAPAVSREEVLRQKKMAQETKLGRLYELYAQQGNRVLLTAIEKLTAELAEIEKKLAAESSSGSRRKSAEDTRERIKNLEKTWELMEDREKHSVICSLVEKIVITHGTVRIEYKI